MNTEPPQNRQLDPRDSEERNIAMQRSEERILTTHVGSLPRSPELARLMFEYQEGRGDDQKLWAKVAEDVDVVVQRQVEAGVSVPSDGEMGKPGFTNYLRYRLEGIGGETDPWVFKDLATVPELQAFYFEDEAAGHIHMPACEGELHYRGHELVQRDIENLKAAMKRHGVTEAFMPAASPGIIAYHMTNRHYPTYEEYLFAAAEAMREEYKAIVEAGLLLQLDCPDIGCVAHTEGWMTPVVEKLGLSKFIDLHIEALNHGVKGLPADQIRMHLCWANYEAPHQFDIPLSDVLTPVLDKAYPNGVLFEAANPRHEHEWELFADLKIPDEKVMIPGVIDTTTNYVEHPRLVAQRIERFARAIGRERVIAGVDCGFGTFVGFGAVLENVVWMKFDSLAQGAAIASERLWSRATAAV
jgi:5-methyltetrahydropteroyltriglutamate--homocysteine methyltransferase